MRSLCAGMVRKSRCPAVKLEATIDAGDGRKMIGLTFAEQPNSIGLRLSMGGTHFGELCTYGLGQPWHAGHPGQVGVDQLSGPVGVAEVMADTAKYSMISFFQLVAFISINLGVMKSAAAARVGRRTAAVPFH